MSVRDGRRPPAVYLLALRATSRVVPGPRRIEWLAEWDAELWYVWEIATQSGGFAVRHGAVTGFCRGALQDARCVRGFSAIDAVAASGSATGCLAGLLLIVALCVGLAEVMPRVRHAMEPPLFGRVTDVVSILPAGVLERPGQGIRLGSVRSWEGRPQHLFSEFAFYQPVVKAVHIGLHQSPELRIARSSSNLFAVLRIPVAFSGPLQAKDQPTLILSESAWKTRFGGKMDVFGQTLKVGLERVWLGGVVPDDAGGNGGHIDCWMLLPAESLARLPDSTRVYPLARLLPEREGGPRPDDHWEMSVHEGEETVDYQCLALSAGVIEAWRVFGWMLLLALLALPATMPLSLGEYALRPVSLPWTAGLRRWLFLAGKIGVALPAVYFGSMDLAYGWTWQGPETAIYLQMVGSFCGILFAMRWALRDQRQRCPVCLEKLSCPARVGQPSRNFLAWNGTELICAGGHGLLHVPELPTSWFSAPRWLYLDASWKGLFRSA